MPVLIESPGIVRDHLEAFLAHARETYDRGLPRYVEQAFRAYLKCGVFAHGFLRLHCDDSEASRPMTAACTPQMKWVWLSICVSNARVSSTPEPAGRHHE